VNVAQERDQGRSARYIPLVIPPLSIRLTTPRLVLRPPRTTDVGELRRLLRHNLVHLKPWNPAPRPGEDPTSITEVSNMVLRHRREWKNGRSFTFLIAFRTGQQDLIGKIALNGVMRGAMHGAYLGYWIDVDHQNGGLCTEGIRAVLDFAFGPAALHRIQAAIMPHNARSIRVIDKLGFRREGYAERYLQIAGKWEDHILYARTLEEHEEEASRVVGGAMTQERKDATA
jgi:[ribosomal protein S5]-alanine N-acetyltransferase